MQRIATVVLCATLWGSDASAQTCATLGNIIGGFAGGAAGYTLVHNYGAATNWITAGLYGAGMAVGALGGASFATGVCENIEAIMKITAEIYCAAGEYLCESIQDVARSMARDFQLCSECTADEVIGAFPMEDDRRERHLLEMQARRGAKITSLRVIPRNSLVSADPSVVDHYYSGMQASFELQRALSRKARTD